MFMGRYLARVHRPSQACHVRTVYPNGTDWYHFSSAWVAEASVICQHLPAFPQTIRKSADASRACRWQSATCSSFGILFYIRRLSLRPFLGKLAGCPILQCPSGLGLRTSKTRVLSRSLGGWGLHSQRSHGCLGSMTFVFAHVNCVFFCFEQCWIWHVCGLGGSKCSDDIIWKHVFVFVFAKSPLV